MRKNESGRRESSFPNKLRDWSCDGTTMSPLLSCGGSKTDPWRVSTPHCTRESSLRAARDDGKDFGSLVPLGRAESRIRRLKGESGFAGGRC